MVILLTGYEEFGGWDINPTAIAVKEINGESYSNHKIVGEILPLRYHEIAPSLEKYVRKYNPAAIIMSGQAGGGSIRLERIAKNLVDCKIAYNCGTIVENELISLDSVDTLNSSLPLELIKTELEKEKIPVVFSDDAGKFGCNQVFYICGNSYKMPSGFIHVPLLPEQVGDGKENMSQEKITKALRIAVKIVAEWISNNSNY